MTPDILNFDRYFEGPELQASNQLKHLGPYFDVAWSDSKTINAAPIEIPWLQSGYGLPIGLGIRQKGKHILIGLFENRSCVGSMLRPIAKVEITEFAQELRVWSDPITPDSEWNKFLDKDIFFRSLPKIGRFDLMVDYDTYADKRGHALLYSSLRLSSESRLGSVDLTREETIVNHGLKSCPYLGRGFGGFMLAASVQMALVTRKPLLIPRCFEESQKLVERSGFKYKKTLQPADKYSNQEVDYLIQG